MASVSPVEVLRNNIFVICKTEMAKSITKRTLRGFRTAKVNARYFEDLINKITNQPDLFISKVSNGKLYWKNDKIEEHMKISAVVGNPPYQQAQATDKCTTNSALAGAIYPQFIDIARKLKPNYISMITPSRWMTRAGRGISDDWVIEMLNCNHFIAIHDYLNEDECFSGVEIKGGVNYFLYDPMYVGECDYYLHQDGVISKRREKL